MLDPVERVVAPAATGPASVGVVHGHGVDAPERHAGALEHGDEVPIAGLGGAPGGLGPSHRVGVAHEHDGGVAVSVAEVTEHQLGALVGRRAPSALGVGPVRGRPLQRRLEAGRDGALILLAGVASAVAVVILAIVGPAVAVGVLAARVGAGTLLTEVAQAVAIEVFGRVDHAIAVGVAVVGVRQAPLGLEAIAESVPVAVGRVGREGHGRGQHEDHECHRKPAGWSVRHAHSMPGFQVGRITHGWRSWTRRTTRGSGDERAFT